MLLRLPPPLCTDLPFFVYWLYFLSSAGEGMEGEGDGGRMEEGFGGIATQTSRLPSF